MDKIDEWNWKDGAVERPEQSRRVVNDVIKEATEGNMGRFYDQFLRGFVIPDNDDGTVGDTEVQLFDLILRSLAILNAGLFLQFSVGNGQAAGLNRV